MNIKRKLYDLLGVAPDAPDEEIRRAYRGKAKALHPDVNGPETADEFAAVSAAYRVLSIPDRRKRYDEVGDEGGADNETARAIDFIARMMEQVLGGLDDGPIDVDVVQQMRNTIDVNIANAEETAKKFEKAVKRHERIAKKFKKDSGKNFLREIVENKIRLQHEKIADVQKDIRMLSKSKEILVGFTFDVDRPSPTQVFSFATVSTTTVTS